MAIEDATSNLITGSLNYFGNKKANEENAQIARENMAAQKEFAQNSISWRVADAKKAGLAPLAALGASSNYYSPTSANVVNEFGGQGGIADSAGAIGRELATLGFAKAKAEVDNLDAQVEKTKAETALLESEKAKQTLVGNMSAPNDYQGNVQGVPKDYLDPLSESMFGVGALPTVLNAVRQQYSKNYGSKHEHVEMLKKRFNLPDLDNYVSSDLKRGIQTAGVPYIRFEPDWDKINKLPVAKQKRVLKMLDVMQHDYSLDKYNGPSRLKSFANKLNRLWY